MSNLYRDRRVPVFAEKQILYGIDPSQNSPQLLKQHKFSLLEGKHGHFWLKEIVRDNATIGCEFIHQSTHGMAFKLSDVLESKLTNLQFGIKEIIQEVSKLD